MTAARSWCGSRSSRLIAWLSAFLVTQCVEVPIYGRALGPRRHRWLIAFGASALTHPIVFFAFPALWPAHHPWSMLAAAEAFAVIGEAVWLSAWRVPRSIAWALLANAASVVVGLSLRALVGWP